MKHYETITTRVPLDIPRQSILNKVSQYRKGQLDRKLGEPCKSANGAYLDGWYSPGQDVPPYITRAEMTAFGL
jgi:hypothetical protein